MPKIPASSDARAVRTGRSSLTECLDWGVGAISRSRWVYYEVLDRFDPPPHLRPRIEALIDAIEANIEEADAIRRALHPEDP